MLTWKRVVKGTEQRLSRAWAKLEQMGGRRRHLCNACGREVARFYSYGGKRFGCPICRSSPRQRFVSYCLETRRLDPIRQDMSILHVAPSEKSLIDAFSGCAGYTPVDLFPELYPLANTQKMDLLEFSDREKYDLVYLSHVMEHVPEDVRVLSNLHRSLKPGGQAWIMIPLWQKPTIDGDFSMPPRERERRFGQWDHVRQYGPDFVERMEKAGFTVQVIKASEAPYADQERYGLDPTDWIFVGRKAS